jgi:alpha-beta hydrolase superfamily lysophospholipase
MPTVTSADGTEIAYTVSGSGPALVLVDGALCSREMGVTPTLLPEVARHFTVNAYDRRGRGESTDNAEPGTFPIERELEDLSAVAGLAGAAPYVCGFSSGAAVVMYAVAAGLRPGKIVLFEAPFMAADASGPQPPADAQQQLKALVAAGRRGDAVSYFMTKVIGLPGIFMIAMKLFMRKGWNATRANAHSLPYDTGFMERSAWNVPGPEIMTALTVPVAVFGGEKSPANIRTAASATATAIPGAVSVTIPGQSHIVKPKPFTRALLDFLTDF